MYRELNRVKPAVIYERRKARYVRPTLFSTPFEPLRGMLSRQAKMDLTRSYYRHDGSSASAFNPNLSESDIPLHPYDSERDADFEESIHQRWDESGHAVGYAPDPRLLAPRPRPPPFKPSALYASPDAALAATLSRDSGDEWSNAKTPKESRLPDDATTPVPGPAPIPPVSFPPEDHASTSVPPTLSPPPSQQSPRFDHTRLPPTSTTTQYMTYQQEHLAVSSGSGSVGTGSEAVQPNYAPHSPPITGFESSLPYTFSPPPGYR
jgi:hypothetical protein